MSVRASGPLTVVLRLFAAAGAGLLLSQAFAPRGWGWLAPVAVAVLTLALWRRSAWMGALLGLVFALPFFLVLIDWMRVVGDDAWVLLSLECAVWLALMGAMIALVTRLPLWPLWASAVWVTGEALRDRIPWGGFAWGRLAFSQADAPFAFLATIGGAPLVTFTVALLGSLLASLALHTLPVLGARPRWGAFAERSWGWAAVDAVAVLAVVLVGLASSAVTVLPEPGTESEVTAAVVQGSVPHVGLGIEGPPGAVLANHVAATMRLAARVQSGEIAQPEFVIWPESSSDLDPDARPAAAAEIQSAVDAIGVPVLVGATVSNPDDPDTVLNQGIVWLPGSGPTDRYSKRHPVPFGEYIPLRPILQRMIDRFALIPRDFAAGTSVGVLKLGPARVGDVICFEVADDEVVRDSIVDGGRLLVVQTNNATYGRTSQPAQQLAITRLRAIEHGRATLVAATSGITAVLDAKGGTVQQLPEFASGSAVSVVTQTDSLTLSDRLGSKPEWGLALVGALAALYALLTRRLGSDARGRAGARSLSDEGVEAR